MRIVHLDIHNVRSIARACVELQPGINLVTGNNGSGKTSLIEAISLLGYARSFLGCNTSELVRFDEQSFNVFARVSDAGCQVRVPDKVGFGYDRKLGKSIRYNEESIKMDALVSKVPLVVLSPRSFELIDGPSKERRQQIDWGVFHVKPAFKNEWRRYKKILMQRNSALKRATRFEDIAIWSEHLANQAMVVNKQRDEYITQLLPLLFHNMNMVDFDKEVMIKQFWGWNESSPLIEQLEQGFETDKRLGVTQKGAHRYELYLTIAGHRAKHVLSRGEKKKVLCALLLSQVELLMKLTDKKPLFLLDDLSSEFDSHAITTLIGRLAELGEQSVITAIDESVRLNHKISAKFHVKQGTISSVD